MFLYVKVIFRITGLIVQAHIQQEKYKQYFEGAEKLFLKPRVVKVLNRLGEGNTHVRKENGGFKE